MRNLEVWYTRFDIEKLMPQLRSQVGGKMRKRLDKARCEGVPARQRAGVLEALARRSTASARIVSDPPLIVRLDDFAG